MDINIPWNVPSVIAMSGEKGRWKAVVSCKWQAREFKVGFLPSSENGWVGRGVCG